MEESFILSFVANKSIKIMMMFTESRPSLASLVLRRGLKICDGPRSSHKFSISKRSAKSINLRFTTRSLMQNIAKRQRNQLARIRDEFVIDKFVDFAIVLYPSADQQRMGSSSSDYNHFM